MTEHETTIAVLREELLTQVYSWLTENREVRERHYTNIDGANDYSELLDNCTTLQLHALVKLIKRGTDFTILLSNPNDHLAVKFAGMYVGIERDGHTHS